MGQRLSAMGCGKATFIDQWAIGSNSLSLWERVGERA
jgi:hypothetical protein